MKTKVGSYRKVTSLTNPVIKAARALQQKKFRDESGQFLAEGVKLLIDANQKGWTIKTVFVTKAAMQREMVQDLAAKCKNAGADLVETSEDAMAKIARRENPQQVIGVVEQRWAGLEDTKAEKGALWIALDRVRDPGNLGTIMRTGDAAGANGVILIGQCCDAYSMEAVRATMGSLFHVPLIRVSEDDFLVWNKQWPGRLIATHLQGTSDFRDLEKNDQPAILLMGNEQAGLTDTLTEACKTLVRIPQAGEADSLNLAVATALMIYEIKRDMLPPAI